MAQELLNASSIDNYSVLRIFPSALLYAVFSVFSINPTASNIIAGFNVINTASVILTAISFRACLDHLRIKDTTKLLVMVLLIVNYAVLNFTYYYPVMTDSLALCVSSLMLYAYLKNQQLNLLLLGIIGAFSWPSLIIQTAFLLIFPYNKSSKAKQPNNIQNLVTYWLSVSFILGLTVYFVLYKGQDTNVYAVGKIDKNLILTSLFFALAYYFFLPQLLDIKAVLKRISNSKKPFVIGFLISAVFVIAIVFLKDLFNFNSRTSEYFGLHYQLTSSVVFGLVKPVISLVSHVTYFGMLFVLIPLIWKSFVSESYKIGEGALIFIFLTLFIYGLRTESRAIINLIPWLSIILAFAFDRFSIKPFFVGVVFFLNLICSKVWLSVNYGTGTGGLDSDGLALFPDQLFFLNFGNRMSENMYLLQLTLVALFFIVFIIILRKNLWKKKKEPQG